MNAPRGPLPSSANPNIQHPAPPEPVVDLTCYVDWLYLQVYRQYGDHYQTGEVVQSAFRSLCELAVPTQALDGLQAFAFESEALPAGPLEPPHPLWQAVAGLPPLPARALTLRFGQGLTNQQLARILNRSETATAALTRRALEALAETPAGAAAARDAGGGATTPIPGQLALPVAAPPADTLSETLVACAPEAPMDPQVRSALLRVWAQSRRRSASAKQTDESAQLAYSRLQTPGGALLVAYRGEAVCVADLEVPNDLFERECTSRLGIRPAYQASPPPRLLHALRRSIDDGECYTGELDLSSVPQFQRRVLLETLKIRSGEIRSYGWLARAVGSPGAARAVGTSMAHNPIPFLIPCHRVVRSDYHIGEYGCGGPAKKRELLAHEGVDVPRLERLARQGVRIVASATTAVFCVPGCASGRTTKPGDERLFSSAAGALAAGFQPCRLCNPL